MKLVISLSLVLDVFPDDLLIGVLPHGVEIKSACPKVAAPEHFLDFRMFLEDFPGSDTLDSPHHSRWQHCRNGLNQKVHMILIGADFNKVQLKTLTYL